MLKPDIERPTGDHDPWVRWILRLLPLLLVAALAVVAIATGLYHHLSIERIAMNYELLTQLVDRNRLIAETAFVALYAGAVAISIPGATVLTLTGGLLFGWLEGTVLSAVGATLGATAIFLLARTSLGEPLARRAGPWVTRLRDGFKSNALSYMLFLRLVPAFPFFVVNLAPAFLGVSLRSFVIGTAIGILPATAVIAIAGDGLAGAVRNQNALFHDCQARQSANPGMNCVFTIDTGTLVTPELLLALAGLGCLALVPVVWNRWMRRHAET